MNWRYRIDFVLFPLVLTIVTALTFRSLSWLAWCALGIVFGTFAEYWVHRVVLHRFWWHGVHEAHHIDPGNYSVLPLWLTPAVFGGFFFVLPYGMLAGFLAWYCWFLAWHDVLHHYDLIHHPLIRAYANWHLVHHRGEPTNYGITIPAWDVVFRTYQRG